VSRLLAAMVAWCWGRHHFVFECGSVDDRRVRWGGGGAV